MTRLITPQESSSKISANILPAVLLLVVGGYFLFSVLRSTGLINFADFRVLNTIFISILMQAFPFMLIGILVSSAMHVFLPDEFIVRIFPAKYGLGFLTAMLAGIFFPVCECAIVPVMTRLVKKGVALPIAVTFMLSAPIINPIVIISTLYAFPGQPEVALMRVGFGLLIALIVGLLLFAKGEQVLLDKHDSCAEESGFSCGDIHNHYGCSCRWPGEENHGIAGKITALLRHSGEEFFDVGKYLILGSFITSLIQTLVPKEAFISLGTNSGLSLLIMMAMAFLFSACSTSDAFIARSFMNRFSLGAIMGFLIFGPMMDVKNILMLLANFKKSFVVRLSLLIFILNFFVLYLLSFILR